MGDLAMGLLMGVVGAAAASLPLTIVAQASSAPPPPDSAPAEFTLADAVNGLEPFVQEARQVIQQLTSLSDRLSLTLQLVDVVSREDITPSSSALPKNNRDLGLALLAEASDLAEQQPPEDQAAAWLAIAERYTALNQQPEAIAALSEASSRVESLREPLDRAERLQQIAAHLADLLQPSQAMAALMQAEALLLAQPPSEQRTAVLASLALQYADLGQQSRGNALITQAQAQMEEMQAQSPTSSGQVPSSTRTPLTPQPWDGSVGLLGSLFSGESSRGVIALSANADRQWSRTALDLGLQLTYNIDDDVDDPDQLSTRFTLDAAHYFAENWQYFIDGSLVSDDLENLELRASLFNGIGATLLRSGDRELGVRTGIGARFENFEEEGADFNSPSLSVGLTYQDQVLDLVRIQQSLNLDAPFGDFSDYLLRSQTSLRIPISDRWSFDQGLRLTLSGERAPDNPGLLLNLQTGLRYQF
ncbi:MAG: DUF481 domain-containing protein [Elainellaceae cyanobacterium]